MRRHDAQQKRLHGAEALTGRQRVQEQALAGKTVNKRESRRLEKARQHGLQRGEIHPDGVLDTLYAMEKLRPVDVPSPNQSYTLLPPAISQPVDQSVSRLPIRERKGNVS